MWEEFPPISTAEWQATIRAELNGADYDKTLLWSTEEGVTVRPFYRREDLPKNPAISRFTGAWRAGKIADIPTDAIRGDLMREQGATAVQEIGYSLAESSGKRSTFVFGMGCNYFFEIAKLRAARQLWTLLSSSPMEIWARTLAANDTLGNTTNNLIRCTTEAMSGIFGGCDVLVVDAPYFPVHLAESLPRVLAEESHFDQVSDPGGGSYYIEVLTASIAAESWKIYESGLAGSDVALADSRKTQEHNEK